MWGPGSVISQALCSCLCFRSLCKFSGRRPESNAIWHARTTLVTPRETDSTSSPGPLRSGLWPSKGVATELVMACHGTESPCQGILSKHVKTNSAQPVLFLGCGEQSNFRIKKCTKLQQNDDHWVSHISEKAGNKKASVLPLPCEG